ncbi:MAG: hypothetical protein U9Q68_01110 [Euryarchaeota archaeon]|nr:hypothetical protein [Euryarchaeota archaeon]
MSKNRANTCVEYAGSSGWGKYYRKIVLVSRLRPKLLRQMGAGTAAGATTWIADDGGGAGYVGMQATVGAAIGDDSIEVWGRSYV